jgi:hypothetical protein
MARQHALFENLKSIVGTALIGLGLFVVYGNLVDATARLSRFTGISAGTTQTFGEVTAVGLAALQVWQSYLFDRQELLRVLWWILISFWPLSLVIAGAVLTGTAARSKSKNIQNKNSGPVDLTDVRATRQ